MKKSMRKGFTLVELLIVIVVIGILSAMMMLSSTEAVSSARAADIISDLRNFKTATLAWYADNLDYVEGKVDADGKAIASGNTTGKFNDLSAQSAKILKYMGNDGIGDYVFSGTSAGNDWYVWRKVDDSKVVEKLASRAKSVGLSSASTVASNTANDIKTGDDFALTAGGFVGMKIR